MELGGGSEKNQNTEHLMFSVFSGNVITVFNLLDKASQTPTGGTPCKNDLRMSRANQITNNIIRLANMQGCTVWRNNTMGVFDGQIALRKIWNLVQSGKVTTVELKKAIASSYRKSHEKIGLSDTIGYTPTARFFMAEIKGKGDVLSLEQEQNLKELGQRGGLPFIVAEEPDKIRLRVMGSEKYITVCSEDDFLKLLIQKMKQPYV